MQYLYIGILIISFLAIENKWILIGQHVRKVKNVYLFGLSLILSIVLIYVHIRINNTFSLLFLSTCLLLFGFLLLCKNKAQKYELEKIKLKETKKSKNKIVSNSTVKSPKQGTFLKNYAQPLLVLIVLYLYLYFQNKVSISKNQGAVLTNTLLQFGMQTLVFLLLSISMILTFVKFKLTKKAYNIIYVMYIIYVISFILDIILAVIFSQNQILTLNIFNNPGLLKTITITIGFCNSICLYTLIIFNFIVWKRLVRSN